MFSDQVADEITFPEMPGVCDHLGCLFRLSVQNHVKFLPYAGTISIPEKKKY